MQINSSGACAPQSLKSFVTLSAAVPAPPNKLSAIPAAKRRGQRLLCQASAGYSSDEAQLGDTASIHFTAYGEQGERLQSTRDAGQALNFEIGSSSAVGNELLQIFDRGILGMRVGEPLCLVSAVSCLGLHPGPGTKHELLKQGLLAHLS